jgi:Terpene cyclase DEP1
MTTRAKLLLALAVAGFVVPNVMVGLFIADHGVDVGLYLESWFETLPSSQLVVDLVIAFLAFTVWAAWDGPRSGVDRWWVVVPASLLVGVCFAIPLYLYMREQAVEEVAPAS